MRNKYTKEFLEPIVKESLAFTEVLRKLGLQQAGGNHSHIRKVIEREGIDTSHFKGQAWNSGKTFPKKYPIEDYLTGKRYVHSNTLKKRLIKESLLDNKCYECGLTEWKDTPIPLELHHIDCNHENNNLDNLTILCPNCHAMIHYTINQNKKPERLEKRKTKRRKANSTTIDKRIIDSSGRSWSIDSKIKTRKVERPPLDILLRELDESNFTQVAKKYGVSDNAIRKWIKQYQKYI